MPFFGTNYVRAALLLWESRQFPKPTPFFAKKNKKIAKKAYAGSMPFRSFATVGIIVQFFSFVNRKFLLNCQIIRK